MQFHINFTPEPFPFQIQHQDKLLLMGSCFSENIGALFSKHKFDALNNPAGILFDPLSIYHNFRIFLNELPFDEKFILERGDRYFSYLNHSSVNAESKLGLEDKIEVNKKHAHEYVKNGKFLFITFGTAYHYSHKTLKTAIANCHKQPGHLFEKKLLQVGELVAWYTDLIKALHALNPELKIIFTVSPVKYLKDGLVENNLSKATLLLGANQLSQIHNCFYFPAFELINDDLRDYRFYNEDLAHPNQGAIKYVWKKMSDCLFSSKTQLLNQKIQQLNAAQEHTPLHHHPEEKAKLEAHLHSLREEILKMDSSFKI
jgi:hypothetical protein